MKILVESLLVEKDSQYRNSLGIGNLTLNILILGNSVGRPSETIQPADLMLKLKRIWAVFSLTHSNNLYFLIIFNDPFFLYMGIF